MTVIRAPSDDDEVKPAVKAEAEVKATKKELKKEITETAVSRRSRKAGKGFGYYIKRVLGVKTRRKSRKKIRLPPGFKPSRNPFFNYLRFLQRELQGLSASEVAEEGGRRWRHMSDCDKAPYREIARHFRPSSGGRGRRGRSGSRTRVRKRSRSRSRPRSTSRGRRRRRRSRARTRRRPG